MGRVLEHDGGVDNTRRAYEVENWYRKKSGCVLDNKKYTFIVGKDRNEEIGSVVIYSDYTKYSITMDVYAPQALTKGLIRMMWDYPFNQLKVQKVFGYIDARNERSIRTFERMGCKLETELKDFFGDGINRLVYTATKEDVQRWVT